jgi:sodium-dependent dicarboxylate transporter 2/3/5
MTYLAEAGIQVTFAEWMLATLPFLLLFLVFLWWLLLRIYPPGDLVLAVEMEEAGKLDARHCVVIAVFLATCLGWLTSGVHPLSTGTVGLVPIIVFFGFRYLGKEDFRNLSWDVLFMLGGGLCLGEGLKASGLTSALIDLIPADAGTAFILFALLATMMTTFMSNTATANLVIPIAVSMGSEAPALAVTIAMMCSTAMALPVCTPPNAIAFGSGILKAREMIRPGLVITVLGLIAVLLLAPAYWKLAGLFG